MSMSDDQIFESKEFVDANLFQPSYPWDGLDDSEVKQSFHDMASQAKIEFTELLTRLRELICLCNPLQTLAHLEFYDCTFLDQPGRKKKSNPEYEPIPQVGIELFQALFLATPITDLNVRVTPHHILSEINSVLNKISQVYMIMDLYDVDASDDELMSKNILTHQTRHHTFYVRNAGFCNQTISILKGLFGRLDGEFFAKTGVSLSGLVEMWVNLSKRYEERINDRMVKMREVIRVEDSLGVIDKYCLEFNKTHADRNVLLDKLSANEGLVDAARYICINDADLSLMSLYQFYIEDFIDCYPGVIEKESLRLILMQWSHPVEGLINQNADYFFLDNPIWRKPIIHVDGCEWFYWPIIQIFQSFGLEMMEGLVSMFPELEVKYQQQVRAEYLESCTVKMFSEAIPKAEIIQNARWIDASSNRSFETDILLIIDSVALIVECKSGRITSPTKRGSLSRMKKDVKKLIEEASEQSLRLSLLIQDSKIGILFQPKVGKCFNLDPKNIQTIIRLTVTLDFFGPLACDTWSMQQAGVLSKIANGVPTVSLVDLENILLLLPMPSQQLHYLKRRGEIDGRLRATGDEMELLAFYLATGFNMGGVEFDDDKHIAFTGLFDQIEPYLFARSIGKNVVKPRLKLCPEWIGWLEAFDKRAFKNWTIASFILLGVSYDDQIKFIDAKQKMFQCIAQSDPTEGELNALAIINESAHRKFGFVCIAVRNVSPDNRIGIISQALESIMKQTGVNDLFFVCQNVFQPDIPYLTAGFPIRNKDD